MEVAYSGKTARHLNGANMVMNGHIDALLEETQRWRNDLAERDIYAFSMDIDWAPEAAIRDALDYFLAMEIPLTVYCTHPSKTLDEFAANPLLHYGIHPNFMAGSSQGDTMTEVADYLFRLVPGAITMRCHRWRTDNDIYELLVSRGILFDSNEISLMDAAPPYLHRSGILSFPVFWEDGAWLWHDFPMRFESLGKEIFARKGVKTINFHPLHFAMNTPFYSWMRRFKDSLDRSAYTGLSEAAIRDAAWQGMGARGFIQALAESAKSSGAECLLLADLYAESPNGRDRRK